MEIGGIGSHLEAPGTKSALPAKETADLEQARKACKDFESILLYHMLSSMRKAFDYREDSGGDFGGDVFKSMIDEQLSLTLARAGGIGLAKLLEQGLGLTGRASAGAAPTGAVTPGVTVPAGKQQEAPAASQADQAAQAVPAPAREGTSETAPNGTTAKPAAQSVRIDELADPKSAGRTRGPGGLTAYESTIKAASKVFGLSADLIRAVILHESGGNPYAVSSKGAKGLMQLTDGTARTLGVTNPFNPVQNIFGGARYLGSLLKMFGGDLKLALASYNAGSGTVKKYGGVPPYKETQEYVKKVIQSFERLSADAEGTGHVYKS
jgi:Rod binding domain-containing protein